MPISILILTLNEETNIGACLDPSEWRRAIWRPDTEGGAMTCDLGLHHLHEPPCPPAAPWMGAPTDGLR